jgi:hypothetical protein
VHRPIRRPKDGVFPRAESFFNVATQIDRLDEEGMGPRIIESHGGRSLHEQSHGESLLALMAHRFRDHGLCLLDEPEAALSPQRQLATRARIHDLAKGASQFIIATYSPISMVCPDAIATRAIRKAWSVSNARRPSSTASGTTSWPIRRRCWIASRRRATRPEPSQRTPAPIMKTLIALLLIVLSGLAAAADTNGLRLFYCIRAEHDCVDPSAPVPTEARMSIAISGRALSSADDFVGFTDKDDTTLQFYVEAPDSILVDMPAPEKQGSYQVRISRGRAMLIIGRLSPPLSRYQTELKLEFAKWK